jgi:hypothetical protein
MLGASSHFRSEVHESWGNGTQLVEAGMREMRRTLEGRLILEDHLGVENCAGKIGYLAGRLHGQTCDTFIREFENELLNA